MARRWLRFVLVGMAALVGFAMAGGAYARHELLASLPLVEGTRAVAGLGAPVTIARDALGTPTIAGGSREDVARALGFVHAQDRLFQMDLQRRQPAGELAALVGPRALAADRAMRLHRLRDVAHRAFEKADPSYRALLEAYAAGVNAGMASLGAPPFEYLVLGATPEPWRPEDGILTVLAMFSTLQGRQAAFEETMAALHDTLPEPMFRFLSAPGSEWETPIEGAPIARPPVPGPGVYSVASRASAPGSRLPVPGSRLPVPGSRPPDPEEAAIIGSNNWAVDAAHSASGAAIVANDMHLSLGVPIIWYRAVMSFPDPSAPGGTRRLAGLTLPGLPALVVGSNGQVAWGFTNSGGDWSDLVRLERDAHDPSKYLTPDGPRAFEEFDEPIAIKGEAPAAFKARWTIWGPVVWTDARGREYAQRWVAHDAAVMASDVSRPERAHDVDEIVKTVAGLGMPNQNLVAADRHGRIAWTIAGAIPRRRGLDGFTPESWADGTKGWDGYRGADEFPVIADPAGGRLWTANAPVVDGAWLEAIGEGGYADGIRARVIRDRLLTLDKATPADMLALQLDNSALFLERWRTLALDTLKKDGTTGAETGATGRQQPGTGATGLQPRRDFQRLLDTTWTGKSSIDSSAYLLTKTFRSTFVRMVMTSLTSPARAIDPDFDYTRSLRGEGPVWALVTERPAYLLDPRYRSWDDFILAAIDQSIADLTAGRRRLEDRTWGDANRAQIFHPLAAGLPLVGGWLNMPGLPLPGDIYAPRAQSPRTGPSERMVVSPGHEEDGILLLPTGQSGHPLSPHYGDQFRAWLSGEAIPFLPGPAVATLTLAPAP